MLRACEALLFTRPYLCSVSVCNLCGYLALWVAGILVCYIYRQQGWTATEPPHGRRDFKMKNVRELETYGAILIGGGIMAYTLMLASVDAPVWATIEFVMGTLFMVVGVW